MNTHQHAVSPYPHVIRLRLMTGMSQTSLSHNLKRVEGNKKGGEVGKGSRAIKRGGVEPPLELWVFSAEPIQEISLFIGKKSRFIIAWCTLDTSP